MICQEHTNLAIIEPLSTRHPVRPHRSVATCYASTASALAPLFRHDCMYVFSVKRMTRARIELAISP